MAQMTKVIAIPICVVKICFIWLISGCTANSPDRLDTGMIGAATPVILFSCAHPRGSGAFLEAHAFFWSFPSSLI